MEENKSVWKETFNYGIILGLISIGFSVLTYMFDLMFKPWLVLPSLIISIAALFFLLRSYRDHYNNGIITFGRSLGAGVVMNIYAGLIAAIFVYVLYSFIDPGLIDKQMAFAEQKMIAKGVPESAIDGAMAIQAKFIKPWFTSLMTVVNSVFIGFLLSLIVSLFVMKKGNPLLDEEAGEKTE